MVIASAAVAASEPLVNPVPLVEAPEIPIAAEAGVFRTSPGMLAIEPTTARYRTAHPRTLRAFRFLRMYPGAPPRIPHGLSSEEFRTGVCGTCHERGGYSRRFSAYVPVTPHPEWGMCLQCHLGEDAAMGQIPATADPNARCSLCHGTSGGPPRAEASVTWRSTVWTTLPSILRDQSPPPIPHELQSRGNCLACHSGPAAVAEIRSPHPERTNCRQCHVGLEPDADDFKRPLENVAVAGEAAP
jgi:cytochrome c-type protein NapB